MKELMKQISQKPVAYYPYLSEVAGSLSAGVLLSQIMYWWFASGKKEFYKTNEDFCQEIGLTLKQFKTAKDALIRKGFIECVNRGVPRKTFYKLLQDSVFNPSPVGPKGTDCSVQKGPTSRSERDQQAGPKGTSKQVRKGPTNTENTQRITENTTSAAVADAPLPEQQISAQQNELPKPLGKTAIVRLSTLYQVLWFELFGVSYSPNYGQFGKIFNKLLSDYSELQVAVLLVVHFNWHGLSGTDEFTNQRYENAGFPVTWLPSKINDYRTFLTQVEGMDFENEADLNKYLNSVVLDPLQRAVKGGFIKLVD